MESKRSGGMAVPFSRDVDQRFICFRSSRSCQVSLAGYPLLKKMYRKGERLLSDKREYSRSTWEKRGGSMGKTRKSMAQMSLTEH